MQTLGSGVLPSPSQAARLTGGGNMIVPIVSAELTPEKFAHEVSAEQISLLAHSDEAKQPRTPYRPQSRHGRQSAP